MPAGRPPKFENPEEMQKEIDLYFSQALYDNNGDERKDMKPISVTGLALSLGFADRQSIQDYRKKDEFTFTIKRACMVIENYLEESLFGNNVTGIIFNLKNNFGWKDKTELDVNAKHSLDKQTDDEIDNQIKAKFDKLNADSTTNTK